MTLPPTPPSTDFLVDPDWLDEHIDDPVVRVVEVDVSPRAYEAGHIPHAVLWDVYRDLKDQDYRPIGGDQVRALFERSGITPDSTVVLYGYAPALGAWLLELHGHRDARVLDCGRDAWHQSGRAWTDVPSDPRPSHYPLGRLNEAIRADRAAVEASIHHPGTTVVDVRSAAEYAGERFWPSGAMEPGGRAGHVPDAVHVPIDGLLDPDGTFRSAAELRAVFSAIDLDSGGDVITYCTVGGRAATAWFALTHLLGVPHARVYDSSWVEWGRLPDTPVA